MLYFGTNFTAFIFLYPSLHPSPMYNSSCVCVCNIVSPGELYFLATGSPGATARAGVIYKIMDPSKYDTQPNTSATQSTTNTTQAITMACFQCTLHGTTVNTIPLRISGRCAPVRVSGCSSLSQMFPSIICLCCWLAIAFFTWHSDIRGSLYKWHGGILVEHLKPAWLCP